MNQYSNETSFQILPDSTTVLTDSITAKSNSPLTVARVLSWLPANATEQEKEAFIRKYFPIKALEKESIPKNGNLPNLIAFPIEIRPLVKSRDIFFAQNPYYLKEMTYSPEGIQGTPLPYSLRTDSFVNIFLLLSFFLTTYTFARSFRFIKVQITNHFSYRKSNLNNQASILPIQGRGFIITQACFASSVLFLDYLQSNQQGSFTQLSPYTLLLLNFTLFLIYFLLKYLLNFTICSSFFNKEKKEIWNQILLLTIWGEGVLLFPLTLLVVYFNLSFTTAFSIGLFLLFFIILVRFYKISTLFLQQRFAYVYAFLYFCTLEISPLLILWRFLLYSNRYLNNYL